MATAAEAAAAALHVVADGRGVPYDCLLVVHDTDGVPTRFYEMRVLTDDPAGFAASYHLYTRWGTDGAFSHSLIRSEYKSDHVAVRQQFESKFYEKTGYRWCDWHTGVPHEKPDSFEPVWPRRCDIMMLQLPSAGR